MPPATAQQLAAEVPNSSPGNGFVDHAFCACIAKLRRDKESLFYPALSCHLSQSNGQQEVSLTCSARVAMARTFAGRPQRTMVVMIVDGSDHLGTMLTS